MKQKLQILGLIFLGVLALYIGFGVVKITLEIIISKMALLIGIIVVFWLYKKNHEPLIRIILVILMIAGIFAFDLIYNIIFLLLVISVMALFRKVNPRQIGIMQISMLIFAVIYLYFFGFIQTISKLLAVLSLMALFMMVIWKEIRIYFTPSNPKQQAENNEIDFVDQNVSHQHSKTKKFMGRFINVEMMTRDIALNITFVIYILLVMIDLLSNVIIGFFI